MNGYPDYKVWVFGTWIKEGHKKEGYEDIPPYQGGWLDLLKDPDFIEFKKKYEITDRQVSFIKKGFHGYAIVEEKTTEDTPLFPFGTHKNKPMDEVPDSYYMFLLNQPWIMKWPTVKVYADMIKDRMNENAASKEEIKSILTIFK